MSQPLNAPARSDDMNCQELVELVTDYLEGTLSERDRARLEKHLTGCDGCDRYLAQMRTTIRVTGRLSVSAVPADGKDKLLNLYRQWKDQA